MIKSLGLYKEENLWKAKSRIQASGLEETTINPVYIPKNSPLAELIISELHKERKHAGVENVHCALKEKFWIPQARQKILSVVRKNPSTKCYLCARFAAKAYDYPEAPPLPHYRVKGNEIFQTVGIDCFGPMTIKDPEDSKKKRKVYGVMFTCALSRAVHLELVSDATAHKFLLAFTRFIRRRRVPERIVSDNGSNFVLAQKTLARISQEEMNQKQMWLEIQQSRDVQDFSAEKGIEWVFITPYAPFRGGFMKR